MSVVLLLAMRVVSQPVPTTPADGQLFQEQGRPEIYLIREGARLHIPNPYVMQALSLDWNAVQTVPPGALDHIPRDQIKSMPSAKM